MVFMPFAIPIYVFWVSTETTHLKQKTRKNSGCDSSATPEQTRRSFTHLPSHQAHDVSCLLGGLLFAALRCADPRFFTFLHLIAVSRKVQVLGTTISPSAKQTHLPV